MAELENPNPLKQICRDIGQEELTANTGLFMPLKKTTLYIFLLDFIMNKKLSQVYDFGFSITYTSERNIQPRYILLQVVPVTKVQY